MKTLGAIAASLILFCLVTGRVEAATDAVPDPTPEVDFIKVIQPILEAHCIKCHGADRFSGDLRLDTLALMLAGGENGTALKPGKPEKSPLYTTTILPETDVDVMPPKGRGLLTADQSDQLRLWIKQGAKWPNNVVLKRIDKATFSNVATTLRSSCISCHGPGRSEAGLRLDTREQAFKGGKNGKAIVPYDDAKSLLYTIMATSAAHKIDNFRFLSPEDVEYLRNWILQGAVWPDDEKQLQPYEEKPAPKK